jgi:hypothetical protein
MSKQQFKHSGCSDLAAFVAMPYTMPSRSNCTRACAAAPLCPALPCSRAWPLTTAAANPCGCFSMSAQHTEGPTLVIRSRTVSVLMSSHNSSPNGGCTKSHQQKAGQQPRWWSVDSGTGNLMPLNGAGVANSVCWLLGEPRGASMPCTQTQPWSVFLVPLVSML